MNFHTNFHKFITFTCLLSFYGLSSAEEKRCLYNKLEEQSKNVNSTALPITDDISVLLKRADSNNDNKISVEEAVKANLGNVFVELDLNANYFITPDEVNIWLKNQVAMEIWKGFRIADSNMDLKLSKMEVSFNISRLVKLFDKADVNKDGYLDFEETISQINPVLYAKPWFKARIFTIDGVKMLKTKVKTL